MKNFFGSLLGSCLGVIIALIILFFVLVGIIGGLVNSVKSKSATVLTTRSVLEIKLNHSIAERTPVSPFNLDMDDEITSKETAGLNDILADIKNAAKDPNISGIYLNISDIPAGYATLETIRKELQNFKINSGGKFIIAYSMEYSQKAYYLATVADKVYLYPHGEVFLKGLAAQVLFFKRGLDKLGVQMQVFRHGKFKSFVEPFIRDSMSNENKYQTRMLVNSIWDNMVSTISGARQLSPWSINMMTDSLVIRSAKEALKYRIVDSLMYPDQVQEELKKRAGDTSRDKAHLVSVIGLDDYRRTYSKVNSNTSKIALIYATGDIIQGEGDDESIGSTRIARTIRNARVNPDIKAIVLRVNSPGGDALASDIIWREVDLAKQVKPVIVSMGDYAASGGYYISCDANVIVAEPTTITGSIGVFGILPNERELWNDKLGIKADTVSTNTHSAGGSPFYPLLPLESSVLQSAIEDIYHTFLTRVSDGRKMTIANVDSIAQGRVWTGEQAIKIGLVDTLGSIDLAMKIAASKAHLSQYKVEEMPTQLNPIRAFLNKFSSETEEKALQKELGDAYIPFKELSELTKTKGVQARMPYELIIQ